MSKWKLFSSGSASMYRPSGKTWPCIEANNGFIWARDDNGKCPSETLKTTDLSMEGLKYLLRGISLPHPSEDDLKEFLNRLK